MEVNHLKASEDNLEALLEKAAKEEGYRPLFYKTLMESELYLLVLNDDLPVGKFTSTNDTSIQVRSISDNRIPAFTSIDRIFDRDVIKDQVQYVAMKAATIFEMFKDESVIIINPYSEYGKELLPGEIRELRSGQMFKFPTTNTLKGGSTIRVGQPANYSTEMVVVIKAYCKTRSEIKGAYLAMFHNPSTNEPPHLMLGLDIERNESEIYGELAVILKKHIPKDELFDMMNISGNSKTSLVLKQSEYQVYKKVPWFKRFTNS